MNVDNNRGTPFDYSGSKIAVYFEVADIKGVKEIINNIGFIDEIEYLKYGFEVRIAIQQIPEIIRYFTQSNIAIYAAIPTR
ncbi:MAG TPA: hypothetical protein VFW58_05385 [Trichococcus sp.]|nr:hypothetical protein [Trichococcus sp.]